MVGEGMKEGRQRAIKTKMDGPTEHYVRCRATFPRELNLQGLRILILQEYASLLNRIHSAAERTRATVSRKSLPP